MILFFSIYHQWIVALLILDFMNKILTFPCFSRWGFLKRFNKANDYTYYHKVSAVVLYACQVLVTTSCQ